MLLSQLQQTGLRVMFGGWAVFIASALVIPALRWIVIGAWIVGRVGTLIYAAGTIPGLRTAVNDLKSRFNRD